LQKKNSELQLKETALQSSQQKLEMRRRAKGAEATLKSERVAFEEECLEDDLSRALIAQDAVEAREHAVIDQCQQEMKVFKFNK